MKKKWYYIENRLIQKVLGWFGLGSSAFLFMACYGPATDDYHLVTMPDQIELPKEEGDTEFFTIVTNGEWEITEVPTFTSVSSTHGTGTTKIDVTSKENTSPDMVDGFIVVKGMENTVKVRVTQHGSKAQ